MTSFKLSLLAAASLLVSLAPAAAQVQGIFQPPLSPYRLEGMVRVQTSVNFFIPGATGEGEDAQKLRDNARRMIYETAAHECDLLRDTLAKECRLESVNVNVNVGRQFGVQQQEGYTVTGLMNLQIVAK